MIPGLMNSKLLNGGAPEGWKPSKPLLQTGSVLQQPSQVPVYAMLSTWYDADIVGAAVRNCFDNGCQRVYILDNASPDATVANAVAAGAVVAEVYETRFYDDDLRIRKQNEFVRGIVESEKLDSLWWVTLDGDEFPTGHLGETVAATLGRLPKETRTIGSTCVDLYPDSPAGYVIGDHPARHMQSGIRRYSRVFCSRYHWKHVAIRYDAGVYDFAQHRGNHYAAGVPGKEPLLEPEIDLPIFHAPLRNKAEAVARLTTLCRVGADGRSRADGDNEVTNNNGAVKRWRALEAIYAKQWDLVEYPHSQVFGRSVTGISVYPWRTLWPELAHLHQQAAAPSQLLPIIQ